MEEEKKQEQSFELRSEKVRSIVGQMRLLHVLSERSIAYLADY